MGKAWQTLEDQLGLVLRFGARRCFEKELITRIQYERYFVSGERNQRKYFFKILFYVNKLLFY